MRRLAVPLMLLLIVLVVGVGVFASLTRQNDGRSEEEIGQIVRDYLMENPQIIFEAAETYQRQQAAMMNVAAEEAAREVIPELRDGVAGHVLPAPGEEDILVVEFFDYNCGFCRRATDFVFDLQEQYEGMTLVLQELPVISPDSNFPARVALSQAGTAEYVGLHRALMSASGPVDADRARAIALAEGLSAETIDAVLQQTERAEALQAELDRSREIASALGIDGTPAFLISDLDGDTVQIVSGYNPEGVIAAIERVRAQ